MTVNVTNPSVLTDQGNNFESWLFNIFCKLYRITKFCISKYRQQSNGLIERFYQTPSYFANNSASFIILIM